MDPLTTTSVAARRACCSPPETIIGVRQPIDAAKAFVLAPFAKVAPTNPMLAVALNRDNSATEGTKTSWNNAYAKAVTKVRFRSGIAVVPSAADGPIPKLIATELTLARRGAPDADLISN
jgi:hypothetical protein